MAALIVGSAAAMYYAAHGLTLSHYDARGHVMVSRRIIDSLTPGWVQIGAVWLPLPHVLNAPLMVSDWAYRTGYPSTALSVLELATGLALLARYLARETGTWWAAATAPALILVNPNVLYLQSTPMTEPLLLGLSCASLVVVDRWIRDPSQRNRQWAGGALVLLMLTRYEGWCVGLALAGLAAVARRRDGIRAAALLPYVIGAVLFFFWLGWATTGRWFTTSGFFVPDVATLHRPWVALGRVLLGVRNLGGWTLLAAGLAGLVLCLSRARAARQWRMLGPLALLAAVALPWYAFFQGHPFRVRYMVPVVVAAAALVPFAVARLPRRWQAIGAVGVVLAVAMERPPLSPRAAMVLEAQWETPYRQERRQVSQYLARHHDGTPILASMGSLGHYMQETSEIGLNLRDFVHEGNGGLWRAATAAPADYVRWVLVEERAEGGDVLAARHRDSPEFLQGFSRVAAGGGLALYQRETAPLPH